MSKPIGYFPGDWIVVCDVCGVELLASEAKHRWDGYIVCEKDFEHRHPMDFIRVKPEKISVPFSRPEPPDQFIPECNLFNSQAIAGIAVAGCARAGFTSNLFNNTVPPGTFNNGL
jgi:hypothetical protein